MLEVKAELILYIFSYCLDMIFKQNIQLGFTGKSASLVNSSIDDIAIKNAGNYAGSYHVLEMGQHYVEYSSDSFVFPSFTLAPNFPTASLFQQLASKSRAGAVTGNIGEIISAIVAYRALGFKTSGIAHLIVKDKKKTPDYLLRKTDKFCNLLKGKGLVSNADCDEFPEWFLMESKATTCKSLSSKFREAFRQLALFWYRMLESYEQGIGYGIIIGTDLQNKSIDIRIFIPKNQANLITFLNTFTEEQKYKERLEDKADKLKSTLELLKNE